MKLLLTIPFLTLSLLWVLSHFGILIVTFTWGSIGSQVSFRDGFVAYKEKPELVVFKEHNLPRLETRFREYEPLQAGYNDPHFENFNPFLEPPNAWNTIKGRFAIKSETHDIVVPF